MTSVSLAARAWSRAPQVLVVDDDEATVELLTIRMESVGMRVTQACDGAEALRKAWATPPDLIVLDLHMPNLDGFGFLARRRSNPAISGSPVVVLSAAQRTRDVTRALGLGARDYMTKPIDMTRLLRRIGLLLPGDVRASGTPIARVWPG